MHKNCILIGAARQGASGGGRQARPAERKAGRDGKNNKKKKRLIMITYY